MIYTDYVHIIADDVKELHQYARKVGIKFCWFEGVNKGHPHYDIPKKKIPLIKQEVKDGIILKKTTRELVQIIQDINNQQRKAA
jgi:hypothetical protein